ncbi:uncharacterized protein LOC113047496 [Carassius auratus]|uniref:Uncharacterized protein LOC113047496 n=1 Tax=Carassius auratus TaxID=7957 RepID=A0A6P6JYL7_CARAU|nr:uncharacterized protein LOC113047496 [Carassius auratus]
MDDMDNQTAIINALAVLRNVSLQEAEQVFLSGLDYHCRMLQWFAMLCCQPTRGQLPPREPLRLLITNDRAHYPSTVTQYSWTGVRWREDSLTHTMANVKHMFSQHEKVTVTQMELGGHHHRFKQFPGALLRVAAAARTLFNIGMSSVDEANQTVNSMKLLFTVFQNDFAQTQLFTALMTDMLWEVSSSNDSLTTGKTPPYMMPLSLVLTVWLTPSPRQLTCYKYTWPTLWITPSYCTSTPNIGKWMCS